MAIDDLDQSLNKSFDRRVLGLSWMDQVHRETKAAITRSMPVVLHIRRVGCSVPKRVRILRQHVFLAIEVS